MSRTNRKSIPLLPRHDTGDLSKSDQTHQDRALDEALADSFPASDPVAVSFDIVFYRATPDAPTRSNR